MSNTCVFPAMTNQNVYSENIMVGLFSFQINQVLSIQIIVTLAKEGSKTHRGG